MFNSTLIRNEWYIIYKYHHSSLKYSLSKYNSVHSNKIRFLNLKKYVKNNDVLRGYW